MLLATYLVTLLGVTVTTVHAVLPNDVSSTHIMSQNSMSEDQDSSLVSSVWRSIRRGPFLSPRQDDGGNGDDDANYIEYDGDDASATTTTVHVAIQYAATTTTSSSTSTALSTSSPGVWDGCRWTIDGTKKFSSRMHVPYGGWNSSYFNHTLTDRPFNMSTVVHGDGDFRSSLVTFGSTGGLHLNVIGSAYVKPLVYSGYLVAPSSQILTSWSDIQYGSVRTLAKGTTNPGAVFGMFFYRYDYVLATDSSYTNETDIELRTWNTTKMWCSNQTPAGNAVTINATLPASFDGAFHEYRIDWIPGLTQYYLDGKFLFSNNITVPTREGSWYWNAWR